VAKKKRKRPYTPPQTRVEEAAPAPEVPKTRGVSPASVARRDRKEEARRQREAIMRRTRRAEILRRVIIWGVVLLGIAAVVLYFVYQSQRQSRLIASAREVAQTQNCSQPTERPEDPTGTTHQDQGTIQYAEQPPTSGAHRSAPLPAGDRVYTADQPADVFSAVHNLEHGYVVVWYRDGALGADAVEALADVANGEGEVILSPYDQLPEGTDLAFTAWNRLQECPAQSRAGDPLLPDQASTLTESFVAQFRNSEQAPEAGAA
jgi:hypothetical protein